MPKVTAKERKQAKNERLYGARVAKSRESLFYKPYNELAKAIENDLVKADDPESIIKSLDRNIKKVFKPLIQKSLFDCWRLNINQFVDYFVDVWKRNLNVDEIASVSSKLLDKFLKKYSAKKVTSISEKTRSVISNRVSEYTRQGLSHNDMVKSIVRDTKGEIRKVRASLIAREETSQCMASTNYDTAVKAKLGFKKWIYRGGGKTNRPNHQSIDGQKVKIGKKFNVPGHGKVPSTKMRFPKDPENGVAGQIIECHCGIIYTRR